MNNLPLNSGLRSVLEAIDDCLDRKQIVPTLVLLYTAIDVVAGLERRPSKTAFIRWVEAYMLPVGRLPCRGVDLYAARCRVLHTLGANSDLERNGEARSLIYAWGTGRAETLRRAAALIDRSDIVLHLTDLRDSFISGLHDYFSEVSKDKGRQMAVSKASGTGLVNMDKEMLEAIVEFLSRKGY